MSALNVAKFTLAGILVWMAISKLVSPQGTIRAVAFLSDHVVGTKLLGGVIACIVVFLIVFELSLAAILGVGSGRSVRSALIATTIFLILTSGWIVWLLTHGSPIPCGCGLAARGADARVINALSLARNAFMVVLVHAVWRGKNTTGLENIPTENDRCV